MKVEKITRAHLAGLELALDHWNEGGPAAHFAAHLRDVIAQAQAAPEAEPVALNIVGYASPGQIEVLREVPRTGGMKVRGVADHRYTEPLVTLANARSALFQVAIHCEQAGAFKACLECGYQDGHDEICKFHESRRAPAQPSAVLLATLERVVHDSRVPNEVSQELAADLIMARKLLAAPHPQQPDAGALVEALEYAIALHTPGAIDGPIYHHEKLFLAQAKAAIAAYRAQQGKEDGDV